MGKRRAKAWECAQTERNLFKRIWKTKNIRGEKLEIQIEAAMPCKKKNPSHSSFQETEARLRVPDKISKTKHACRVESDKSTRQGMEPTFQRGHEDHIAAKGENSLNHYISVHKFIPKKKAMRSLWEGCVSPRGNTPHSAGAQWI